MVCLYTSYSRDSVSQTQCTCSSTFANCGLTVGCVKSGHMQSEECENTSKDCSLISVLMSQSSQVMLVSEQP